VLIVDVPLSINVMISPFFFLGSSRSVINVTVGVSELLA
jgi:hypothetical protein